MPHVVLEGPVSLEQCQARFEPFVVREGDLLVKVERFYRESAGRAALIETLVVDHGHTQKFFIQLSPRDGGLTVRLEPLTDPEKTTGVRRALALVAHRIRQTSGCAYGSTNLEEYLIP
ncbi:MAG TPA: hypothetical protein VFT43_02735 [Candidatus Polarisedimenticolia bacterium]|nr:hypothetical protein [Candidatus Polarisedimenticolia bacterium]